MNIIKAVENRKDLISFIILNYLDKGLAFLLPLIVLYICDDKTVYNKIEYVYSIAGIAIVFFNLSNFGGFYFYKESNDRTHFLKLYQKACSIMLLFMVAVMLVAAFVWNVLDDKITLLLCCCVSARLSYLLFINNDSVYYRLIDKAYKILLFSIVINIISISLVFLFFYFNKDIIVPYFITGLVIPIVLSIRCLLNEKTISIHEVLSYYKDTFFYAWPIFITTFLGMFVNNFGKIFAFNTMSPDEMYSFSYTLRISLIIQLAHSSIMAYFSKRIFLLGYSFKLIVGYLLFISSCVFVSFAALFCLNQLEAFHINITWSTLVLFLYTYVFCAASFFGDFFSRRNLNRLTLYATLIATVIYALMFILNDNRTLGYVAIAMLMYSIVRMVMYLTFLWGVKRKERLYVK